MCARRRYRNPNLFSDLTTVLATFNYSKETLPPDHIYAALGLVKSTARQHQTITPDYSKPAKQASYEAAVHSIIERQDLYLWGTKTLLSNRTMGAMPSWVPEWNRMSYENGAEHFSYAFGRCIPCQPSIRDHSLYVSAHILDRIEYVARVREDHQIVKLIAKLNCLLTQRNRRASRQFEAYLGRLPKPQRPQRPQLSSVTSKDLQLQNLAEVVGILSTFETVPKRMIVALLRGFSSASAHPLDNTTHNLEAIWSVLTPTSHIRLPKSVPAGQRLFLAMLFLSRLLFTIPEYINSSIKDAGELPKDYSPWI